MLPLGLRHCVNTRPVSRHIMTVQNVQEAIIVYICDSSDGRQIIRHRKFNAWFNEYNTDKFTKQDCVLKESNGTLNPISLIIKKEHIFSYHIKDEFKITIDGYNASK